MQTQKIDFSKIYTPHKNQLLIHEARKQYRYRVVVAGRRFGKTALGLNEAIGRILQPEYEKQLVWIILPGYKQARNVYWIDPDITKYFIPYLQTGVLVANNIDMSLYSPQTGSRLFFKGADQPDSLRGSGLDLIIWDEVQNVRPNAFAVMSPSLADSPYHEQLYIGTPDGFNHFHDFALMGDHHDLVEKGGKTISVDSDYITFRFTSYDNATWPEGSIERQAFVEYIDKERKKYYEVGQGDWFEQEYMAQFRKRAGAVHKHFDRNLHVIPDMLLPFEWKRFRGFDFGSTHPTASVKVAIDTDDNWFIERCYKESDRYTHEHIRAILEQDDNVAIMGYGDPSGAQWIREFNLGGLNVRAAKKDPRTKNESWLQLAIDKINEKMFPKQGHDVYLPNGTVMHNAPSLFILGTAENMQLVDEIESLAYLQTTVGLSKADVDETKDPKGHYDLHAALRYFAVSYGVSISYVTVKPLYSSVLSPLRSIPNSEDAPPATNLHDEDVRKQLERQADLEIMNRQKRGGWL